MTLIAVDYHGIRRYIEMGNWVVIQFIITQFSSQYKHQYGPEATNKYEHHLFFPPCPLSCVYIIYVVASQHHGKAQETTTGTMGTAAATTATTGLPSCQTDRQTDRTRTQLTMETQEEKSP